MERLDSRVRYIPAMEAYLEQYGRHFNKALADFAISGMTDRSGNTVEKMPKEKVYDFLRANNVTLKNDVGYDAVWVLHMKKSDGWGSSITDEVHLARSVKDFLDDPDGYPTKAFDHFYTDCVAKGIPIFWEDFL